MADEDRGVWKLSYAFDVKTSPFVVSKHLEHLASGKGNKHSYWKWPFIADLPIGNGDFP